METQQLVFPTIETIEEQEITEIQLKTDTGVVFRFRVVADLEDDTDEKNDEENGDEDEKEEKLKALDILSGRKTPYASTLISTVKNLWHMAHGQRLRSRSSLTTEQIIGLVDAWPFLQPVRDSNHE